MNVQDRIKAMLSGCTHPMSAVGMWWCMPCTAKALEAAYEDGRAEREQPITWCGPMPPGLEGQDDWTTNHDQWPRPWWWRRREQEGAGAGEPDTGRLP